MDYAIIYEDQPPEEGTSGHDENKKVTDEAPSRAPMSERKRKLVVTALPAPAIFTPSPGKSESERRTSVLSMKYGERKVSFLQGEGSQTPRRISLLPGTGSGDNLDPRKDSLVARIPGLEGLKSLRRTSQAMKELEMKVVLLGDCRVGKTSFAQRYVTGAHRDNYKWTVGVDFALKLVSWSNKVTIKLQLWDVAGQDTFSSMTRVYYKDAHAAIIMFDLSRRTTFDNAIKWKNDLDEKCALPDGTPVPCILLANKCDLDYREVDQNEIEALCREGDYLGWTEVSVKEALMTEEAMRFVLEDFMANIGDDLLQETLDDASCEEAKVHGLTDSIKLTKHPTKPTFRSKCCC